MAIATMTSKGQITIPIEIRERLGADRGTRLSLNLHGDVVEMRVVQREKVDLLSLCGSIDARGIKLSIEDMNEVIRRAGSGDDRS
jgi:antitoxin PrlF